MTRNRYSLRKYCFVSGRLEYVGRGVCHCFGGLSHRGVALERDELTAKVRRSLRRQGGRARDESNRTFK